MSKHVAVIASLVLAATSVHGYATELTVARSERNVVPVLVTVNRTGKVTKVFPSQQLRPSMDRLLRQNIREAVVAPMSRDGKSVSSQVVLRMRLDATPRTDGKYDVKFVPVEVRSVPFGAWYWLIDGARYALVDGQSRPLPRAVPRMDYNRGNFTPPKMPSSPSPPASTPSSRSTKSQA